MIDPNALLNEAAHLATANGGLCPLPALRRALGLTVAELHGLVLALEAARLVDLKAANYHGQVDKGECIRRDYPSTGCTDWLYYLAIR